MDCIYSFNNLDYFTQSNIKMIGSAHNEIEIREKIDQGCEEIFVSPIFNTKSHTEKVAGDDLLSILNANTQNK